MNEASDFDEEYERMLALRREDQFAAGLECALPLLERVDPKDIRMRAMLHNDVAHFYRKLGEFEKATPHYIASTTLYPSAEIASIGLYITFVHRGMLVEAYREAYRYVESYKSLEYEEIFLNHEHVPADETEAELLEDIKHALLERRKMTQ